MKNVHGTVGLAMAMALVVALPGCATSSGNPVATLTQHQASAFLVQGKTGKEDVRRAYGDALVTRFESGREAWFYQFTDNPGRFVRYVPVVGRLATTGTAVKELKILFDRDGHVQKFILQELHAP